LPIAGSLVEAEAAFHRAAARGRSAGAFHLGLLFEQKGDLAAAQAAFKQADEGGEPGAALKLGMFLMQAGDVDGARTALTRAARSNDEEVVRKARPILESIDRRAYHESSQGRRRPS
jgi:Flp pilus assembly protein TadD